MCILPTPPKAQQIIPANTGLEAERAASMEAALRRRRSASANILTSPTGIPAGRSTVAQLGQV